MTTVWICLALIACLVLYIILQTYREFSLKSLLEYIKVFSILVGVTATAALVLGIIVLFGLPGFITVLLVWFAVLMIRAFLRGEFAY